MRTKVINVTQRDIFNGSPGDACNCPVALATRKAFKKGEGFVRVDEGRIYIGQNIKVKMTKETQDFVGNFDCAWTDIKPFSFTLKY